MPVEIRELQINVTVDEQKAPTTAPAGTPDSGKEDEKKAIISECVEQVMEIISHKKER